jgi:hypothetical protein
MGKGGAVAQLVEQWTENPCVAGSIPAHTTNGQGFESNNSEAFFFWYNNLKNTSFTIKIHDGHTLHLS